MPLRKTQTQHSQSTPEHLFMYHAGEPLANCHYRLWHAWEPWPYVLGLLMGMLLMSSLNYYLHHVHLHCSL